MLNEQSDVERLEAKQKNKQNYMNEFFTSEKNKESAHKMKWLIEVNPISFLLFPNCIKKKRDNKWKGHTHIEHRHT